MKCSAKHCQGGTPPEKTFCETHWFYLPSINKIRLCDSYGTEHWEDELKTCKRVLYLIDAGMRKVERK